MIKIRDENQIRSLESAYINGEEQLVLLLAQTAGKQAASAIKVLAKKRYFKDKIKIVFLAGSGMNGCDAMDAARELAGSNLFSVTVIFPEKKCSENARVFRQYLDLWPVQKLFFDVQKTEAEGFLSSADILVDGLLGIGADLSRPVYPGIVDLYNSSRSLKIALDLPSGLGGSKCFAADYTLVMQYAKKNMYCLDRRPDCGRIVFLHSIFPDQLSDETSNSPYLLEDYDLDVQSGKNLFAYKNKKGHLAIWAGSCGFHGAALLAAETASLSGTGLVSLFVDEDVYAPVASQLKSVMVKKNNKSWQLSDYSAVCAGPGWSKTENRTTVLRELLASGLPLCLDADALWYLKGLEEECLRRKAQLILTPHVGELAGLLGCQSGDILADPYSHVQKAAEKFKANVLLKSYTNFICTDTGSLYVHDRPDSMLGTAGSGDVLFGLIAGLLSTGASAEKTLINSVLLHSLAGKILKEKKKNYTADSLPSAISEAFFYENR